MAMSESMTDLPVIRRDIAWAQTVRDGIVGQLDLDNDFENMIPMERIMAAIDVAEGEKAQNQMFDVYSSMVTTVPDGMVERGQLPARVVDEDIYSDATLALLEAIPRWDSTVDHFGHFATLSIKRAVMKGYINRSLVSGIGIEVHAKRAELESLCEKDPDMSVEDLVESLGIMPNTEIHYANGRMPGQVIKHPENYANFLIMLGTVDEVSADTTQRQVERSWEGAAAYKPSPLVEEVVANQELPEQLSKIFSKLDTATREILDYRAGLEGQTAHSVKQTLEEFKVSAKLLAKIEAKAMEKLKWYAGLADLRVYLED